MSCSTRFITVLITIDFNKNITDDIYLPTMNPLNNNSKPTTFKINLQLVPNTCTPMG